MTDSIRRRSDAEVVAAVTLATTGTKRDRRLSVALAACQLVMRCERQLQAARDAERFLSVPLAKAMEARRLYNAAQDNMPDADTLVVQTARWMLQKGLGDD